MEVEVRGMFWCDYVDSRMDKGKREGREVRIRMIFCFVFKCFIFLRILTRYERRSFF